MNVLEKARSIVGSSQKSALGPTLVVGGTGKTGSRVAQRLTSRGRAVRIGSRSGQPPFDWQNRATWAPAFEGIGSIYLTFYPDLTIPGAVETVRSFVDLAVERDVRRIVLLSGRGEEEAQNAEQVVRESGADWTIVRSSWFAQNFSEGFFRDGILDGELVLPVGEIPEPFVDADDIADVAVKALTEAGHGGRLYEVTGPRMLTFAEAVARSTTSKSPRKSTRSPLQRRVCRPNSSGS
jgi:uncharacterized protein YbjT (DUF2867 family)